MLDRKPTTMFPLLACAALLSTAANAGPPSLPTVVQAGYERYPQRPLSEAVRAEGSAVRRQASSLLADDPAFMLRHENDSYIDNNGFRQWEGGLEMPLWLPGQREQRRRVATATDNEADGIQRLQRWRVAGEVRELLWSLRITETELALSEQAVESAGVLESDVDKRYRAGELARTDLILARKEVLARKSERVSAASRHKSLLREYRTWTGLSELPADIRERPAEATGIPDNHPALDAARRSATRAREQRNQVRTEKRANPLLTLGGKTERAESGLSYDTAMTVEVNLPLGTRSHAAVRVAQAERGLTQATVELAQVRRDLENELIRATTEREGAGEALQLAEQQYALAGDGLRLTRRAFELGESDLFTLLQARGQALAAERELRLRRHELEHATARVNQALGVIPE
jgi:outer membrane protein TolC